MFGRQRRINRELVNQITDLTGMIGSLGEMVATLERRVSRWDNLLDSFGSTPQGVFNRLVHERNKARDERDTAEAEVTRLMQLVHGPQMPPVVNGHAAE